MEALRPNKQRAENAILLIWLVLSMEIVSLISDGFQYVLLKSVERGNIVSMNTLTANDTREQWVGIIYMIVYIISAVTFIKWFRRAYYVAQRSPYRTDCESLISQAFREMKKLNMEDQFYKILKENGISS